MLAAIALAVAGLVILALASDQFVVGAARLAVVARIPPVVIGAVIVGFGTSAPELVVSLLAAAGGAAEIGIGNVVGSNLANVTLVLGAAGLLARPPVLPEVLRREVPLSLVSVLALAVALQNGLTRTEGGFLLAGLVVVLAVLIRAGLRLRTPADDDEIEHEIEELVEEAGEDDLDDVRAHGPRRDIVRTVLGLAGTLAGAQLLVEGAKTVAGELGLSGGFVGITVVAIGTSLPELVTAVQAARQGETALLIGNILGSNIFNSLAVAGAVGLAAPTVLTDAGLTVIATGVMALVVILASVFLASGGKVRRWEAAILLAVYAAALPFMA